MNAPAFVGTRAVWRGCVNPCGRPSSSIPHSHQHLHRPHLPHPADPAKTVSPLQPPAAPSATMLQKLAATLPDRPVPSPHESLQATMRKPAPVSCFALLLIGQ